VCRVHPWQNVFVYTARARTRTTATHTHHRTRTCIRFVQDLLLQEGMAWIDDQAEERERRYYFPSLMTAK
jgi:hypothetical protein